MRTRAQRPTQQSLKKTQQIYPQLQKQRLYQPISYQKRVQLINLAGQKGYNITKATKELGIKLSTGKFIVKSYRDKGKILRRKEDGKRDENKDEIIQVQKQDLPKRTKAESGDDHRLNKSASPNQIWTNPFNQIQFFWYTPQSTSINRYWNIGLDGSEGQPIFELFPITDSWTTKRKVGLWNS